MPDSRLRFVLLLALLGLIITACGTAPPAGPANRPAPGNSETMLRTTSSTSTYYMDCKNGNDANSGLRETQAWKSLVKANSASLGPGGTLLFKRGCTWDGQLNASWTGEASRPVVISAYGNGRLPRIRTTGSQQIAVDVRGTHLLLEHLEAVVGNRPGPARGAVRCPKQAVGWRVGFAFHGSHNTVRHSTASRFTAAVHFVSGTTGNKALYNTLRNNDIMSRNDADNGDNDSGAWGVLLNAHGNEVAHNSFSGNIACSEDYGIEGASVEIYQAGNNLIRHNSSVNDSTFSELDTRSEGNTFVFNLFAPLNEASQKAAEFLVVPGSRGTRVYHNTAYQVQVGVACFSGCDASVLDFRNNIVVGAGNARKQEFWSDLVPLERHNVFGRIDGSARYYSGGSATPENSQLLSATQTGALFVSPPDANFRLAASGAGADAGEPDSTFLAELGVTSDLDGKPVPYGPAPDAGAYERQF